MAVWLVIVLGWLTAAAAISTGHATRALQDAQAIDIEAGATATISGSSLTRQVTCNAGHLTLDGTENTVTVSGHCASLTVNGIKNTVTIDAMDTIANSGIDGHVIYHSGTPTITNTTTLRGQTHASNDVTCQRKGRHLTGSTRRR